MKKIPLTFLLLIMCTAYFAQNYPAYTTDSIYFKGRYYNQKEYDIALARDKKLNFETYFMPGLGYTYYQPKLTDSTGTFSGLTVEYLIVGKVEQNDDPGPSHVRFYSKLNILKSNNKNINSLFMYGLGLDLSLEKNPNRNYMIPYFGLEFCGVSQKQFGSTVQFTPTLGVHVISNKNIFINIYGGYVYPLRNFEMMQGWTAQAGVNFALW